MAVAQTTSVCYHWRVPSHSRVNILKYLVLFKFYLSLCLLWRVSTQLYIQILAMKSRHYILAMIEHHCCINCTSPLRVRDPTSMSIVAVEFLFIPASRHPVRNFRRGKAASIWGRKDNVARSHGTSDKTSSCCWGYAGHDDTGKEEQLQQHGRIPESQDTPVCNKLGVSVSIVHASGGKVFCATVQMLLTKGSPPTVLSISLNSGLAPWSSDIHFNMTLCHYVHRFK